MVRDIHPMVRDLIEIDRPDQVDRADKLLFHIPGQVAGVEKLKLAQREQDRQATCVV